MKRLRQLLFGAALALSSCGGADEQVIRHLVVAELIQSEKVPESFVEIQSVKVLNHDDSVVHAKVLEHGGRAGQWNAVECQLKKHEKRWAVTGCRTL